MTPSAIAAFSPGPKDDEDGAAAALLLEDGDADGEGGTVTALEILATEDEAHSGPLDSPN